MKKFITVILLFGWVLSSYSQKVIQLEETKLNFEPTAKILFEDYANGIVKVRENYAVQFQSDAIKFMKENFDVLRYIEESGINSGDIIVTAKSSKGYLRAVYNDDGNLVQTFQKFKDIALPPDVRNEVYNNYKGWTMSSNKFIASGRGEKLENQKYVVTMQKGKQKDKFKVIPTSMRNTGVASIVKN